MPVSIAQLRKRTKEKATYIQWKVRTKKVVQEVRIELCDFCSLKKRDFWAQRKWFKFKCNGPQNFLSFTLRWFTLYEFLAEAPGPEKTNKILAEAPGPEKTDKILAEAPGPEKTNKFWQRHRAPRRLAKFWWNTWIFSNQFFARVRGIENLPILNNVNSL